MKMKKLSDEAHQAIGFCGRMVTPLVILPILYLTRGCFKDVELADADVGRIAIAVAIAVAGVAIGAGILFGLRSQRSKDRRHNDLARQLQRTFDGNDYTDDVRDDE